MMKCLKTSCFVLISLLFLGACSSSSSFSADVAMDDAIANYRSLIKMEKDPKKYSARNLKKDSTLRFVGALDWTSGFYPGVLWYMYEYSEDPALLKEAKQATQAIEEAQFYKGNHDVGFMIYCSYGNGLRITKEADYAPVIENAANSLMARFDPEMGLIKSWSFVPKGKSWNFPVIIDNMMNLELLFEASIMTKDPKFKEAAIAHANKTLMHHFRADNSSFHVVDYDTTTLLPREKCTHQGLSDGSAWTRGQAWGLYGYTMCYRYTKDPAYLEQAEKIASFFLNHKKLPADQIPYWDFDAVVDENTPRDVSAAAVLASALLELQAYSPEQADYYLEKAKTILKNIHAHYQNTPSEKPNLALHSSTGSVPHNSEINVPIIYADYYYVEALMRLKRLEK